MSDIQRIREEYEALRRQSMEEARERWEQMQRMRPPMPMSPYYAPPGYGSPYPEAAPAQR
ncbi:hypothetical protein F2Q65_05455 [Thiohalocapsa marina]|uniref:Uncharacterized protein n=1 Tax=Thiohalocapsa marina TaxID=424902 RepID=A0A5M8FMY0_9GAMM|nr:hypothetical protein [Thiohalocapsa marina]KAA6186248.1 hypothetical protein F2Q65_05455 [Thiohalocapsa marina]